MFDPTSSLRLSWDVLILIVLIYSAVMVGHFKTIPCLRVYVCVRLRVLALVCLNCVAAGAV